MGLDDRARGYPFEESGSRWSRWPEQRQGERPIVRYGQRVFCGKDSFTNDANVIRYGTGSEARLRWENRNEHRPGVEITFATFTMAALWVPKV